MEDLRLDTNFIDYAILAGYFLVVLGVGFAAKRYIKTSLDYFLSGRSLPAWITGLAFISANLVWALTRPLSDEFVLDERGGGPGSDQERPGGGGDARPQ